MLFGINKPSSRDPTDSLAFHFGMILQVTQKDPHVTSKGSAWNVAQYVQLIPLVFLVSSHVQ